MTNTLEQAPADTAESTSVQPIVPGFHPDPTICRVGSDYYLANSSFEYSPGVPLWHSTDLLRWELVGNVLERPDQFSAGSAGASKGVFAPTLRHHDGRFWLITTDVSGGGGQLVVSAEDPAGPWSSATRIPTLIGIDPDLAWTPDGECYVTYCATAPELRGIAQARVDLDSGRAMEPPRSLWQGTGLAFPEAPHLYQHDGWWYLVIAEGGTERGHSVSVARSVSPEGPFESAPSNPLLSHRSTTHPVQNTGHADLVQCADGGWAAVYLGVRPAGMTPMFHVNGRETFLAGVDWVDGWPVIDESRFSAPVVDRSFEDDFAAPRLHPRWVSPSVAVDAVATRRAGGGVLLQPARSAGGTDAMMGVRTLAPRWRFEAEVHSSQAGAAVRLRLDDRHWCEVRLESGMARAFMRIGPLEAPVSAPEPAPGRIVTLAIEAAAPLGDGPDEVRLLLVGGADGDVELARVDGRYLSTEVAGGFTGRVVGVRAPVEPAILRTARYRE
ncbi:family 43 glycosylhydrolase [Plantibacter auratus]|uniref:glycoside hydrolase family 43 protein n=1 Tax=Plantibacter auratus TaxID=272914 RepID=UPI003D327002